MFAHTPSVGWAAASPAASPAVSPAALPVAHAAPERFRRFLPSPAQELVAELGRSSRLPRFRQTPSLPNVRVSAAAPSPHDHFYFQNFSPNFLCSPWKLNAAAFSGVFGELCRELCPQGILHTVLVLDRSCWCLLVPVPSSAEEWAKLSLPPLAAHSSALQVWKLRWDHGAVAAHSCPLCRHHSAFSVPPPARLNQDFLSSRGGERQSACAAHFNGELCFLLASALP